LGVAGRASRVYLSQAENVQDDPGPPSRKTINRTLLPVSPNCKPGQEEYAAENCRTELSAPFAANIGPGIAFRKVLSAESCKCNRTDEPAESASTCAMSDQDGVAAE
jgi:hypothetical protein